MNIILGLSSIAILPVALSGLLNYLEKKTAWGQTANKYRQILYGCLFGLLAIIGTECGVDVGGAAANTRDSAVLVAGLLFGAPAGILAGFIGGIERYLAVYWGAGTYTRLACSLSTILAGFIGAGLRLYLFDDKRPTLLYALFIGFVTEVLHMLMIFFTNMNDVETAFFFVRACSLPMITVNGAAVMLSTLVLTLQSKDHSIRLFSLIKNKQITALFQKWLLLCVLLAFVVTCIFAVVLQQSIATKNTRELLSANIDDAVSNIQDATDRKILEIATQVCKEIKVHALLSDISQRYSIAEINLINRNGIILQSTNPDFVGYDMSSAEQSKAFLCLLDSEDSYVQDYQPIGYDHTILRKYAGVSLPGHNGFVQIGYDAQQLQASIDNQITGITRNSRVGRNGFILITTQTFTIVSGRDNSQGRSLSSLGLRFDPNTIPQETPFQARINEQECTCMYRFMDGYYILSALPQNESLLSLRLSVYITAFMEILVYASLFILIYFLIKKLVINNIRSVNESLSRITHGDLDEVVNIHSNEEFSSLSDDINATVNTLKQYIAQAESRLDKELEMAKVIQSSTLPHALPGFSHKKDIDLFATMDTAKEVGGDFYDYYLLDENRLAFLIADVSGKGITAALFMMKAKTILKSFAERETDVSVILTKTNQALCEGNEAEMFVTCWMGILNFETNTIEFANAGHNPPLLRRKDGSLSYFKTRPGLVLASMEGVRYRKGEMTFEPGDEILLYTDGVTEATDKDEQLYGEARLMQSFLPCQGVQAEEVCSLIKADVDKFVADAPQFDDITLLSLKYRRVTA